MHTATEEGIALAPQVVTFSDSVWFLVAPKLDSMTPLLDTESRLMTPLLRLLVISLTIFYRFTRIPFSSVPSFYTLDWYDDSLPRQLPTRLNRDCAASSMSPLPPSSHTSPYTGEWEYDVFLCFRGDDTRLGFTSHLMNAISTKQIRTFIDDKLEKTKSIDELVSILQRSALSVVVFSDKFADSSWCLDEVATIAPRMAKFGHRILPVFYNVDPSDVTDDSGSYSTIIDREYKGRSTYSEDKKRWMDALKAVANCSGHTSQAIKIESDLIKAIVEDVQKQLIDLSSSIKSANLVGMGSRILEVERLLAMDVLDDTRIIGLWGMGGVGKTTLAKACYGRITLSNKGIKHLFIRNITEICGNHQGVEKVVRKLYSKLLDENNIDYEDLDITYRRERLSRMRVFIVLDNVETLLQLEQLALGDVSNLTKIFAAGSRIVVTTRNKKVLQNAVTKIYDLECLNDKESTQLFSLHAFKQDFPRDNWTDKSRLVISYCRGNPLALKILGGALFGEDIHYWKSFLSGLRPTGQLEIQNVLRKSYDTLGGEEKKIFLDVACLLHNISRSRLITYMETKHPSSCAKVKDLIDRSLLTCVSSENGENIEVHDLLKEMAWNIVKEEPILGKRSRLVDPDDIHKLLTTREVISWPMLFFEPLKLVDMFLLRRKKRKVVDMDWKVYNPLEERTTEGISLDLRKANEMYLEANAFDGMNSLTFLRFWSYLLEKKKIHLPYGGLNSLPSGLRWLQWDEYPSKFLPSKFYPQHLVHLIMRKSPIERCWQGYDQLESLPKSIWNMVYRELVVKGSPLLESLPEVSEPIYGLTDLSIIHCGSLKSLPSSISNIRYLKSLDLSRTGIRSLPSNIHELGQLVLIKLSYCKSLESIPSSIHKLSSLTKLYMYGCESIRSLPELPPNLFQLELSGCKSLQALPSNTLKLMKLVTLKFEDCPQLDQTIPVEIVTNFLVHASLAPVHKGKFLQSRSELPEWFMHKNMNLKEAEECIVTMELPLPKDGNQTMIKGIVFGAVYSSHYYHEVGCDCKVGNTIISSWTFYIQHSGVGESDNLWLMFDKKLSGDCAMGSEENEAWYVKYAGLVVLFKFYIKDKIWMKKLIWKECGVSLLY
ncbi:Disease resistance-like protein DSC1 [Linum perenne]